MLCKLLYFSLVFSVFLCAYSSKPLVQTTHGDIVGKVLRTLFKDVQYFGFLGIPYAAPPVKKFRFMPPQPIDPWNEILNATKEKQPCFQFNNDLKKDQSFGHYGAEDCLYLDVYTPALDQNKRAVIIFLHNVQLKYTYNKTDYRPDFFIEEDVVIVTINHRLSLFGFLSLEEQILPGNAGLKNIVAGLEWVKNNAIYFGGDPKRITLMGSQGGAAAVDLLIHSRAKEFFNSAILQSGTSWSTMYLQGNARNRAFRLAELLERSASNDMRLLAELNVSPEALLGQETAANPKDYSKENQRSLLAFGPVVESPPDGLVTEYPERVAAIDMPVMIRFNSREGLEASLQYLIEPRYLSFLEKDFPLLMPKRISYKFDPLGTRYYDAVEDVKKFYFGGKIKISSVPEYVTYIGDVLTVYAVHAMARKYANISSSSVFYYQFDYYSELSENKNNLLKLSRTQEGTWGAAAGDDLCYLFVCTRLTDKYKSYYLQHSEEIQISMKMVRLWSNFAKFGCLIKSVMQKIAVLKSAPFKIQLKIYGNPTPSNDEILQNLNWPRYQDETKQYLHIGKQLEVRRNSINNRFRFWDRFLQRWGRRVVDGTISEATNKDEL